ncbi:MAG: response regulator [Bacteriovoracaceae bacterium]|nr:response regulator [Bacteriovoracaceae bacterium]
MKGNLLIIDDEIELSESMRELFEEEAHEIFTACNGEEALRILDENPIDCVVSDIKMPVMDGLKFMKIARERGHAQPIIFFTGHGTEQLKDEVKDLGAADLLMKPNFLMLELAIRKHMASI